MFDDVLRTLLPNGLTVLVRRDASAPVAAVVTRVRAGYFDETDDVVGISHVLEHMYFKGTPTRGVGAVARATKARGGYLNAHTIYDHTSYVAVLPREGFLGGLEIQADAFAHALIDAGELRRELDVIIQEARRKLDAAAPVALESLYALLHDRHRIRRWRIGREEELRTLTREAVHGFYRNFYRPGNAILAMVGDVEVDEVLARVQSLYGSLEDAPVVRRPGPDEGGPPGRRYHEMAGDVEQSHFALGWRTPGTLHADTPALDLFAGVLGEGRGSRLYRGVRERRLASRVSAFNYTPDSLGVFSITGEGDPGRMPDALAATWDSVRRILEEGPDALEVDRARHLFEARWRRRLETMEGQAELLAQWESMGDWRFADRYFESVMTLEADAMMDAVRNHLDPDQASVLVYRPSASPPYATGAASAWARFEQERPEDPAGPARPAPEGPPRRSAGVLVGGRAALERHVGPVFVFRSRTGVPILVRRRPGAPVAHLGVLVAGGAAQEPDALAGLATLAGRTALKGTAHRGAEAIAFALELLGGAITPTVTSDGHGWTLSVPAPGLPDAVRLLAELVQEPRFDPGALEVERAIAMRQLAQLRDDMYRYPVRLATAAAFGTHPYARGALGSESTLQAVTAGAVRSWHAARVLASPAVLAIVSDADPEESAALLAEAFDTLRPGDVPALPRPRWPESLTVRMEPRERAQTALAIGFPAPARRDAARTVAGVLASLVSGLGGRFFEALRDRQSLAYTVTAYPVERAAAGMFIAYIATSPELEEQARVGLLVEFERLRAELVSEVELERARTYTLGARAVAQQDGGVVLAEMAGAWLHGAGLEELEDFSARVRGVTPQLIRELAEQHFRPEWRVEGIVRGAARPA